MMHPYNFYFVYVPGAFQDRSTGYLHYSFTLHLRFRQEVGYGVMWGAESRCASCSSVARL